MKIVHVGPQLARAGGPAGYLLQLQEAAAADVRPSQHDVCFPPMADTTRRPRRRRPRLRGALLRAKRTLLGRPRPYRPSDADMARRGGPVRELYERSKRASSFTCDRDADVLFVHDVLGVRALLDDRRDTQIWLMVHSPIPMGLYLAWNWGVPEAPWRDIAALPDVQDAIEEELDSWQRVDRLLFPCPEAFEELVRVDERFSRVRTPCDFVLSGSNVDTNPSGDRPRFSLPENERVGLFLGNGLAYRGLDALLEAISTLPPRRALPGVVAVAGPEPDSLPSHPRLVRLGRVDDVPSLLASTDFLVNTNRFSLFDLSNIEGAAAGKPFLLHAVGGNETLRKLGAGCHMVDDLSPRTVADGLAAMFRKTRDELTDMGRRSRTCYEEHLTAGHMWRRHLRLYDEAEMRIVAPEPTSA